MVVTGVNDLGFFQPFLDLNTDLWSWYAPEFSVMRSDDADLFLGTQTMCEICT